MSAIRTLVVSIGALLTLAASAQAAQVSVAKITGPIPVTAQSGEPYRGSNEQPVAGPGLPIPSLIPFGYIEEEYFVSGEVDGKPYTTSLLVRKPKDPKKFSGLVAVETVHAQGAIPFWGQRDVWLNGGHGWAAVGSQKVALEQYIRKSNPTRYASLQLPDAAPAAGAQGGNPMAGGAQGKISQEILTQVGLMLKSNLADGPFKGMKVKYLLQGGSSQTGGTTLQYIRDSHAGARMPDGKPIYDGYLPMEAFSPEPIKGGDAVVIHAVGEGDFGLMVRGSAAYGLRGDSDEPNDRYREYEIVASSHVPTRGISDPKAIFPTLEGTAKPGEQLSQFPSAPIYRAMVTHLVNWVMKGTVPPHAQPLERVNGEFVLDEYGNAKGGVRSAYVDVPLFRYTPSSPTGPNDNAARRMIGQQEPIPADKLKAMYKSRANYLKLFNASVDQMVKARFLFPEDAKKLKEEEKTNPLLSALD